MRGLIATVMMVVMLVMTPQPANAAIMPMERHAAKIALAQRGDPYVYGAVGPNAFDCSGLVYFSYRHAGFKKMPRTAEQQYRFTRKIRWRNLRRGDLIFYHYSNGYVFHVAIYLGHGRVVEGQRPGSPISIHRLWKYPRYAATLRKR